MPTRDNIRRDRGGVRMANMGLIVHAIDGVVM